MKTPKFAIIIFFFIVSIIQPLTSNEKIIKSKIQAVKLYQNQAQITRATEIDLKKGNNIIIIGGLPRTLYDWSIKSKLPRSFKRKILSLEVEKKALLSKRQKKISIIEKKLENLREADLVLLDNLKNIRSQLDFLKSILTFTEKTASKELVTRIPQVKVWDNTLTYVMKKKRSFLAVKRKIEKKENF